MSRAAAIFALIFLAAFFSRAARATILWSDLPARTVHNTGAGADILGGAVRRTITNNDALYFKFHVDPLSDEGSEPYFAGFQLFEQDAARLGVGNAMEAWGYSAFMAAEIGPDNKTNSLDPNDLTMPGEYNLKSAHPEPAPEPARRGQFRPYEVVRRGLERTIVFKVQFVPGGDDLVTVWLDPHLGRGATEDNQPENLTTKFKAKATFDQIRLRQEKGDKHDGSKNDGGNGWIFSDLAIATSFDDFVVVKFWQTWWFNTLAAMSVLVAVGTTVRLMEKRKYQMRLRRIEQQSALERERTRIAQDLHDELGSSLTRISLLSGLLQADKNNSTQAGAHAEKIAQAANQTVRSLEEIVWAVRPGSDTLQSLVDYLTHFAGEIFEGSSARCLLDVPDELPAQSLPPDLRHNIFLIVKETLTNTLKHAGATEVQLQIKFQSPALEIFITDNGQGFDPTKIVEGKRNGLGNMKRRAEAVGGKLTLTSSPGAGTRTEFSVSFQE